MSLHLYPESRTTSSSVMNNSPGGLDSDPENDSSGLILNLERELKKERDELAKIKKEKMTLSIQLQSTQEDGATLQEKYDGAVKTLHRANSKINELQTLCDSREDKISELNANLESTSDRIAKLNSRLESFVKESAQLHLEKSLSEEKIASLEEEVRQLKIRAHNDQELLAELEHLRTINLNLRRDLVVAKETGHRLSVGSIVTQNADEEQDSPDRMIYDPFDEVCSGLNLHQELSMLGNPLKPLVQTSNASVQSDAPPEKVFSTASTQTITTTIVDEMGQGYSERVDRDQFNKIKKENMILSNQLQQTLKDGALLEEKYDDLVETLHRANGKINELQTLNDAKKDNFTYGLDSESENFILNLEKEREEFSKIEMEKMTLKNQLQQTQDDGALLREKYDGVLTALHRANSKIDELEILGDTREDKISELNANLESTSERVTSLGIRLETFVKESSRLCLIKSQSVERISPNDRNCHANSDLRWFWMIAVLALILAFVNYGGRLDFSPVVTFFTKGVKFVHRKGMPPH